MIILKNINKKYVTKSKENAVVKDVSLIVKNGDFISIMGRSGCGKTTLLNIIGCMDRYDSGDYWYDERNINDLNQKELANFRNKKIGYVFQAFHLIDDMKAIENVELPMGYAHMPRKLRKERAKELLHMVGLDDKINSLPSQLSGGQQQRVAIARALANNPALILADEPTGNLDYNSGKEIMKILKNLNDKGSTIIMVTHDNSIADYAKNKLTMFDGMLV